MTNARNNILAADEKAEKSKGLNTFTYYAAVLYYKRILLCKCHQCRYPNNGVCGLCKQPACDQNKCTECERYKRVALDIRACIN